MKALIRRTTDSHITRHRSILHNARMVIMSHVWVLPRNNEVGRSLPLHVSMCRECRGGFHAAQLSFSEFVPPNLTRELASPAELLLKHLAIPINTYHLLTAVISEYSSEAKLVDQDFPFTGSEGDETANG